MKKIVSLYDESIYAASRRSVTTNTRSSFSCLGLIILINVSLIFAGVHAACIVLIALFKHVITKVAMS